MVLSSIPRRREPLVLRARLLLRDLEVGDHPPEASEEMTAEEGDEDELEDGEHPRVEHLLEALHVPAIYGEYACDTSARDMGSHVCDTRV